MRAQEFLEAVVPQSTEDDEYEMVPGNAPNVLQQWDQSNPQQWTAKDPIISDPSSLEYLGLGFVPDEVYRYSPYNPDSPYAGAIARNIYSTKVSQIKDMIRARKPKEAIVAFIDSQVPQSSKRIPWVASLLALLHGGNGQQLAQR